MSLNIIFVMGYSRSGTKLLCNLIQDGSGGRILNVGELHLFGRLIDPSNFDLPLEWSDILRVCEQFMKKKNCPYARLQDLLQLFDKKEICEYKKSQCLNIFFNKLKADLGITSIIDGTPRNAYYVSSILKLFPTCKIIYMQRDPRSCIASQKLKPSLLRLKNNEQEAQRLEKNYNSALMARFWVSSYSNFMKWYPRKNILKLEYEDLIANPEQSLAKVGSFVELEDLSSLASRVSKGPKLHYSEILTAKEILAIEYMFMNGMILSNMANGPFMKVWRYLAHYQLLGLALMRLPGLITKNRDRFRSIRHEIKYRLLMNKKKM